MKIVKRTEARLCRWPLCNATRTSFFCDALVLMLLGGSASAQVQFQDVTDGSGLEYSGESYGGAWGDANGDRRPDLFVSHHRNPSGLYINLGGSTFENRGHTIDAWQETPTSDVHGGTWADYDNDGRQDLVITAGRNNFTQFLVNDGTTLSDRIDDFTFDNMQWPGRYAVWNDFDNDGLLDLAVIAQGFDVQLHLQQGGDFVQRNAATGHTCTDGDYSLLSDLTMDGNLDWICVRTNALPERIYDTSVGLPFQNRTSLSNSIGNILDVAVADFDGDQIMEMFALRGKLRINGAEIVDANSIEAHFTNQGGSESGLTFRSTGTLTFELHWSDPVANQVFIGSGGRHPPSAPRREPLRFELSPSDPTVVGVVPHNPAVNRGVYVGYTPATQTWSFSNSSGGGGGDSSYTYTYIDSSAPVTNLTVSGIPSLEQPRPPSLLKYNGTRYTDQLAGTGLDHPVLCNSVAAADFDNDMDVDLYYVCRAGVSNLANRLYLNDGTGRFSLAPAPFGAEGPTGPRTGIGENVMTSDFDVDGFMDLFVTNGLHLYPEPPNYTSGGPDKLFRNLGNGKHWAEFDLRGTVSNRDGIGATVIVTAGGKTQRREANGGYKRWAQHDRRLHFGLGTNSTMNVSVRWPSGTVDHYANVPANGLYEAVEGGPALVPITIGTPPDPPECVLAVGMAAYDAATDRELFLWRDDCSARHWNVRATGGAGPAITFAGSLESDQPLSNLAGAGLDANDVLSLEAGNTRLTYALAVGAGAEDGYGVTVAPSAAAACFGLGAGNTTALVGPARTPLALPFDLVTLEPCEVAPPAGISIDDVSVQENVAAGVASFTVSLSAQSDDVVSVMYNTMSGSAAAPGDYTATSGVVTFFAGETTQTIDVAIVNDSNPESDELFTVGLSAPDNATLDDASGTGTIVDDDEPPFACGTPTYDKASERALFLWQDCATGSWSVRVTAGGPNSTFSGEVRATTSFTSVTPFGIEANDLFAFTSTPGVIEFGLIVGTAGQDGFNFSLPAGQSACLTLTAPAVPIYAGSTRLPVTSPVDVATMGACGDPPDPPGEVPVTQWINPTGGVSATGNSLAYSGAGGGWNAHTVNSAPLSMLGATDEYKVEFAIGSNPAGTTWVLGFGITESEAGWRDVDFGLRSSGGVLSIYEGGAWVVNLGNLAVGDRLGIAVNGTQLEYRRNGATVRTRTITPQDFYIDSSFKEGAILLDNFILSDD